MAACTCVRSPAGGVIPCRMVPSMRDEVHGQLHDVTGNVQRARLCIAVQRCTSTSCRAGSAHFKFKHESIWNTKKKQTSLSGEHDFPGQG